MKSAKGFTLIEVIMALLILAIVLSSSMLLLKQVIQGERFVFDKTLASWVAQNYVVQQQIEKQWPALGLKKSEAEMGPYTWVIKATTAKTANESFRKTNIEVFKKDKEEDRMTQTFSYSTEKIRW